MSRFEDEHQPAPALEGDREPRLLTRSGPPDRRPDRRQDRRQDRKQDQASDPAPKRQRRQNAAGAHRQHAPERGLRAWAQRLGERRAAPPDDGAPPPARMRRRHRLFAAVFGASLLLIVVTALVMVLDLRHALTASLPALDGNLTVAGLQAPVTVTRNGQGVPDITAGNLHDLLFAQGYITASDRLWQMDGLRRHAAGELAAVLGPALIDHDRRQRLLQLRAAADRAAANLPPDQRTQLQDYADGVNAFIAARPLPVEFHLLAYRPAPWVPRDSLLVYLAMFQDLSTQFPRKLDREALGAHLPAALLPDLYPAGSWRDLPPAGEARDLTTPHEVEQIPLDPSQARVEPAGPTSGPPPNLSPNRTPGPSSSPSAAELLAVATGLGAPGHCDGCRAGSNNWAVSGAHTASGKPLLSNDMHLNLDIPDIWYENGLHAAAGGAGDALDATGFSLPGVPFIVVGRNAHVAWGMTNLGADVQDLLVEHLRGTGQDTTYEHSDGSWAPVQHHPERIHVRGGLDVRLDVLTTTHRVGGVAMETPLVSPMFAGERRSLALAWTVYDPNNVRSPLLGVDEANDGASLVAAFAGFGGPCLNLVWADDGGHIGYHAIGRIPIRGPAVQHPRAIPTVNPEAPAPQGIPLPAEGDEGVPNPAQTGSPGAPADDTTEAPAAAPAGADAPQGYAAPQAYAVPQDRWPGPAAHLLLSAYRPDRALGRRRMAVASRSPLRSAPRTEPARRRPGRGRRLPRVARLPPRQAVPLVATPPQQAVEPVRTPLSYTVGSAIPSVPVDALDPAATWSGYIGYDELPAVTDPANGVLATANSRVTPDDYPYAISDDWADAFRTDRIQHLLRGAQGLTPADMLRIQNDVHSDVDQAEALRLAYAVDHASAKALGGDGPRLRQAANLLRSWDGNMTVDSAPAAVITAAKSVLWPSLLIPQILAHDGAGMSARRAAALVPLYTSGERNSVAEVIVQNQPARWLPRGAGNWNDFLTVILERGLRASSAPSDLHTWSYGRLHTVEIAHPLFGEHRLLSDALGIRGTTGPRPAPGDATTIKQIGAHFGPSERFTADLSGPDGNLANLTTGESGDGRSPWYLDQFLPWLQGTSFDLRLHVQTAEHTLHLLPAAGR